MRWMAIDFATADLDGLAECRNAWELGLKSSRLNEEILARIGTMVNLKNLYFTFDDGDRRHERMMGPRPDLTNASRHLAGLTRLKRLCFRDWALTDDQMGFMGVLPALSHLSIYQAPITGAGFGSIQERSRLRLVAISQCPQFNDEGLARLLALKELGHVTLFETGISEEAGAAMVERLGGGSSFR